MLETPIRVLQIMGTVESGGVEAVIMNYYRHIDKTKVQFDFVMHKGGNTNYIEEVRSMGAKVYEITPYTKNIIKFTYEIYKIVKEGKYQIVHSNMNALSGFPLFAAYMADARVRILHNHTTDTKEEILRTTIKRLLRPFAKAFANEYWACSKLAGEWMCGKDAVENNKVSVINNAIDLDRFAFNQEKRDELREKLGIEDKFVVGHVGRFMKQKNHEFLIEVFAKVAKQKENAVLLLIGEGSLMDLIEDKVKSSNLTDKVIFLGARSDVADLYNVMDVFLFPSLYEGLGMVAVEAQVNGLPVLASTEVPVEVKISNNINFIKLSDKIKKWSDEVIKIGSKSRWETKEEIVAYGFDIRVESRKLEESYMFFRMVY